jgi:hypothetical protein
LSFFSLDIEPAANNCKIYYTEYLQNMRVQIQYFYREKINIPECKRCQAYFHTKGYWAHRSRCVKCGKSHRTEKCTIPKTQPAIFPLCGELHTASYRGYIVYKEIICTRFSSLRSTASIHIKNTPGKENKSHAAPRPKIIYAQATRNSIETPTTTANNTQEHTLIKIKQKSFTRFETIFSKQAEQMSMLLSLLTTALNKLLK